MNKIICTIVTASVLVGGAAYGQNKSKTTHDKQPLRDSQMDKVTAAGEENSSIAANNSTVTENNTGTVNLSGTALSGAKGVNIVNSSDALVANGVNVYDSSALSNASTNATSVGQANTITQNSGSTATLTGYSRGANSQLDATHSHNETETSSSSKTLNASFSHSQNHSESSTNNFTTSSSKSWPRRWPHLRTVHTTQAM